MFCDMVGSSALSTRLDPEEQGNVIAAFHTCCADEIKALGGMVAQYLGDGVLAYFGYPTAHENDAERAILAGLAILKSVASLSPAADVAVQTRIAIGSGVVVVGDLVRQGVTQENAAIGETTNLAARLQAIAEPNSIVISPVTHRLVGALFDYRDLGRHTLKGFPEPVHVRQVLGVSKVESRFEAQHQAGTAPLLGRDEELDLLLRRWEDAKCGHGRIVLLTGEPGIGKSRIARALRDQIISDPHTTLTCFCSPLHQSSALYPHIVQLTYAAGIERDDSADAKLDKLQSLLSQTSGKLDQEMPLLAALLSIPGGNRYPVPEMTPQRRKERTLAALLDQLKRLAARQPVLVVYEDLHWIDPTSLELLSLAVEQIGGQRILLLATARPEFTAPWPGRRHVSALSLNRFGRSECEALIAGLTKGKGLPPEVRDQIVARTDGVPLFIEELTKTVLESGLLRDIGNHYELTGPLPPLAIPSTLHASLLARLDRLAVVKDVAQIGATIGREFTFELIAAVAALPEANLRLALEQLTRAELLFQSGAVPHARFIFKHALVRDTAYASLVRTRRQQLHAKIACVLEANYGNTATEEPALLAQHYLGAGEHRKAIIGWRTAARLAIARSALVEAASLLRQAIDALGHLGDTADRLQLELDLTLELAATLRSVHGYAAPAAEKQYLKARELCLQVANVDRRFSIEWGLFQCYFVKGEMKATAEIADNLVELARANPDHALVDALLAGGMVQYQSGDLEGARKSLEAAVALARPEVDEPHVLTHGQNPGVFCASYLARTLWLLGYPDRARAIVERNVAIARTRMHDPAHLHSYVNALTTAVGIYCNRREPATVHQLGQELLTIARRSHYTYYQALAEIDLAWAASAEGDPAAGIARMQRGLVVLEKTGTVNILPNYYVRLAEFLSRVGRSDEAMQALEKAEHPQATRIWYAEVERIRGELLASMPGQSKAAEATFLSGLEIARRQRARSLELRTTASYALFLKSLGRSREGRELLERCLGTFDEGWETQDVREARALLTELTSAATKDCG
jgi:class 3 adenylate cyclase/tetratricopeptide (TPR) repeat protein